MKMEKMDLLRILLKVSIENIIFTANVKWKTIPQLGRIYTKWPITKCINLYMGILAVYHYYLTKDQVRPAKTEVL